MSTLVRASQLLAAMSLLGLGDYDSPSTPAEGESPAPGGVGKASAASAPAAAPAASVSKMLGVVAYSLDADDAGDERPENTAEVMGVSIDDDAVQRPNLAIPRKVGSVQYSVVRAKVQSATAGEAGGARAPDVDEGAPTDHSESAAIPEFVLPDSPSGVVDPRLADKFLGLVQKSREGFSVNEHIRNAKQFRNPDLLEKLVEYYDVREFGTNYPPTLYDPAALAPEEHFDKLEELRLKWEQRQMRRPGEKVQFTSSSEAAKGAGAPPTAGAAAAGPRKSKWDSSRGDPAADPSAKKAQL